MRNENPHLSCVCTLCVMFAGANFSFHKEKARPMPEAAPVVSHSARGSDLP